MELRFKRVSGYSESDGKESFMLEQIKKETATEEIIDGLVSNFDETTENALKEYKMFYANYQLSQNANRKMKINTNPGFLTTIAREKMGSESIITMSGIDDVRYLDTIVVYMHALKEITKKEATDAQKTAYYGLLLIVPVSYTHLTLPTKRIV